VSVADRLGLQDLEGVLMGDARVAWRRWCAEDFALGVVGELDDLPEWTRHAPLAAKDDVLARIAALTAAEQDAVTVLAWLLVPGATRIAAELADLHPDIDSLVAGQLWIEISRAYELVGCRGVARAILRRTRSAVMGELGVGDAGDRRDRAWAHAVPDEQELTTLTTEESEPVADYTLLELLKAAYVDRVAIGFDLRLLWDLAQVADRLGAPAHRGRMGLTTPAVVEAFAAERHLNARSVRRRACEVLDRLQEYVSVRDDAEALAHWKLQHPPVVLSAREELELAIEEEKTWWLMTGPEHLAPEDAWSRAARNVIPRHARRA
jgi:hypothetical protein